MKVLVLASEPISADQLRAALAGDGPAAPDLEDVEIRIVAPALHGSAFQFWISDADEAISKADAVWRTSVAKLGAAGVDAQGDTGEGDPLRAVEDALANFDADRIVVFTHPESEQRYREDIDDAELEERFGRPVEHVATSDS
ncbi:MAG TPA: hypothetical protein VG294_12235 [Solirubrobacteraceae bacterium]|jgi:hypothetical protein|nr:hypothetical protein [Solirubrobacteraceae bacterium]